MGFAELKGRYIQSLYEEKAFLISAEPRPLHHGGVSHLYLNHNQFLTNHKNLRLLADLYTELLSEESGEYSLGAVDSVMSPILCGMLSISLEKNVLVVKEKKLEHGLQQQIYGEVSGEILLIDDVTSTGTLLYNAAEALRDKGGIVKTAILSACRDLSAVAKLETLGVKVKYVATYEEIIQTLWNTLTDEERDIVRKEVSEKKYSWDFAV